MFWLLVVGVVGLSVFAGERRATLANWLSKDSAARRRTITVSTAILACMPLLAITLYLVGTSLALHPVTGPDPESFFAQIGLATSYSVPILLVAVGLGRHGHRSAQRVDRAVGRHRSERRWHGCLSAELGRRRLRSRELAAVGRNQCDHLGAVCAGLAGRRSLANHTRMSGAIMVCRTQINVACGFFSIAMVGVLSVLWWDPRVPVLLEQAAVPWGWCSVVSVVAACFVPRV